MYCSTPKLSFAVVQHILQLAVHRMDHDSQEAQIEQDSAPDQICASWNARATKAQMPRRVSFEAKLESHLMPAVADCARSIIAQTTAAEGLRDSLYHTWPTSPNVTEIFSGSLERYIEIPVSGGNDIWHTQWQWNIPTLRSATESKQCNPIGPPAIRTLKLIVYCANGVSALMRTSQPAHRSKGGTCAPETHTSQARSASGPARRQRPESKARVARNHIEDACTKARCRTASISGEPAKLGLKKVQGRAAALDPWPSMGGSIVLSPTPSTASDTNGRLQHRCGGQRRSEHVAGGLDGLHQVLPMFLLSLATLRDMARVPPVANANAMPLPRASPGPRMLEIST
ncbi:hypothetical protein BD779DRAFT_1474410 [Infundibulicybe gibba]|nr:hypothetical protein BD779DRAFT_1474410 [Infundibulicybe gibba]